jgi:hypothetical protein
MFSAVRTVKALANGDWLAFILETNAKQRTAPVLFTILNAMGAAKVFYISMFPKTAKSIVLANMATGTNFYNSDFDQMEEDGGRLITLRNLADNESYMFDVSALASIPVKGALYVIWTSSNAVAVNDYFQAACVVKNHPNTLPLV